MLSYTEINGYIESLFLGQIDRGAFYMKIFQETGSSAALFQAHVSMFSGWIGGAALGANYLMTDGAKNQDPISESALGLTGYSDADPVFGNEIYFISQQVALDFGDLVAADIFNGNSGDINILQGVEQAQNTWNDIEIGTDRKSTRLNSSH